MNNDFVDSNGDTGEFRLACSQLLTALEKASSSQPFIPIEKSQYKLAEYAAKRIPHSLLVVNPDDETTFLVAVDEEDCSQTKYVYLRNFHSNGRTVYEIQKHGLPNDEAIEATKDCIKGWLDWDGIKKETPRNHEAKVIGEPRPTEPRLQVVAGSIRIDSEWFAIDGGPKARKRLFSFFSELVSSEDLVTLTDHTLKTRDIESLAKEIQDLLEDGMTASSAGFRIKKKYFRQSENRLN